MTTQQVLSKYDEAGKKGFYYNEIRSDLSNVSLSERSTDEFKYEMLAFSLVGSSSDKDWYTYYGPLTTGRKEDGTPVYYPSLESITNEAVLYWEQRLLQTKNPLLRMQYAGIIWDFKKKVCQDKYPSNLYSDYVNAMLDVVNGDYEPHDVLTVNVLERLSDFTGYNKTYKEEMIKAFQRFDRERAKDDASARLWGAYIQFLTSHKGWVEDVEEQRCVQSCEERLARLASPSQVNPWAVKEQALALADYYKSRTKPEEIRRVLRVMEQSFRNIKDSMPPLQWMGNLEMVANSFANYNLADEKARLLKEIEQAGEQSLTSMQAHKMELNIPKEAYSELKDFLTHGDTKEQYETFCLYYIPRKDQLTNQLKKLSQQFPLVYLMPTQLMDEKGRPSSVVGGIESDFDGQLILHVCKSIQFNSSFLHFGIKELEKTGALSIDNIMSKITGSPIFSSNRIEIIRQALLAYKSENYITMCHLLVPQIEDAFRLLVDKSGSPVIKPQKKSGGFTQRTLDEILRDKSISNTFGDDFAYYSRIVLTDQRGMNIRNNLCHGLVAPSFFNETVADRILHILCVLSLVCYK